MGTAPGLRIRLVFDSGFAFGPGKAELLAGVARTGSISAAGRAMGMSYKKAWQLVDDMNRAFRLPLVDAAKGGASGGGAQLTETGQKVLILYRQMEEGAGSATDETVRAFGRLVEAAVAD